MFDGRAGRIDCHFAKQATAGRHGQQRQVIHTDGFNYTTEDAKLKTPRRLEVGVTK